MVVIAPRLARRLEASLGTFRDVIGVWGKGKGTVVSLCPPQFRDCVVFTLMSAARGGK